MANNNRISRSFTIDPELDEYISKTKGTLSASERINEMLARAMRQERYERLEAEAQAFFRATGQAERKEVRALQAASLRSITRD